jgi:hypothetical protein
MVWVHGGGFIAGSGSYFFNGPDFLVGEGVIVVTLNYRLGALGRVNRHWNISHNEANWWVVAEWLALMATTVSTHGSGTGGGLGPSAIKFDQYLFTAILNLISTRSLLYSI